MQNYKKNRQELIDEMIDEFGHIFCENCGKSNAFNFQCHHIFWRSEKPNHKNLHHKRNLIILGVDCCHNKFHEQKELRENLVEERNLIDLFK